VCARGVNVIEALPLLNKSGMANVKNNKTNLTEKRNKISNEFEPPDLVYGLLT
jgi:hypothetical protein